MKKYFFCIVMLAFLCCGTTPVSSQERSRFYRQVVGYVKDRENHPVAGAKVCANPRGPVAGMIPCKVSKADGSFKLDVWWPDTYIISAEALAAGYPNATWSFYGSFFGELPVISVHESNELKPVEVRVGPQAGRVIFKILDDESGQLIESGAVKVCRTDNPKAGWSMSTAFPHGKYELLAPEVPFTIKFEIWGSGQEWEERSALGKLGVPVEMLKIELGTRNEMTVRLRRVQGKGRGASEATCLTTHSTGLD
jgi:hypothetical protein